MPFLSEHSYVLAGSDRVSIYSKRADAEAKVKTSTSQTDPGKMSSKVLPITKVTGAKSWQRSVMFYKTFEGFDIDS